MVSSLQLLSSSFPISLTARISSQNYPWGKSGQNSLSARLCAGTPNPDFAIEDEKEYAEMWMGDYPVLPAKVLETGEGLHKVIDERREELLGKDCAEKFGGVLPFLPKVYPPISRQ